MLNFCIVAVFFLMTLSLLGWLYIFFHPARSWDFQPIGDDAEIPLLSSGAAFPRVAVIVPARNEAESLPRTLPALVRQDYPADFKIYLVDDRSTDQTASIALQIARKEKAEERLRAILAAPLPE